MATTDMLLENSASFSNAKKALVLFLESGYKDAFIRDLNLLIKK